MIISRSFRLKIYTRDGFSCAYCKRKFKTINLEIDHIYPVSKGGKDLPTNLVTACVKCNRRKSNKIIDNPPIVAEIEIEPKDFKSDRKYLAIWLPVELHTKIKIAAAKKGQTMIQLLEEIFK